MIVIAGAVLGALTGGFTARRRKGSAADIAQYAAGFGICFGLAGLILTIALDKILL
ncbi:apolipoprotein acyltransferase [Puniceibacterium confluentis]|uniref:apolipoprotein acyltransferase n=1 Tax=Puniceibacterium confluentis TaxID=1958944 RepID=UPI0011B3E59A|nr:apolipoprotein acyltransferase [Puniceibacterium confluentis]